VALVHAEQFVPKLAYLSDIFEKFNILYTKFGLQGSRKMFGGRWVGGVSHPNRKALNIFLPFTTSYLCKTWIFSSDSCQSKACSMMNLENDLKWPSQNSSLSMISYVQRQPRLSHQSRYEASLKLN
jgi:hypothetical protein